MSTQTARDARGAAWPSPGAAQRKRHPTGRPRLQSLVRPSQKWRHKGAVRAVVSTGVLNIRHCLRVGHGRSTRATTPYTMCIATVGVRSGSCPLLSLEGRPWGSSLETQKALSTLVACVACAAPGDRSPRVNRCVFDVRDTDSFRATTLREYLEPLKSGKCWCWSLARMPQNTRELYRPDSRTRYLPYCTPAAPSILKLNPASWVRERRGTSSLMIPVHVQARGC